MDGQPLGVPVRDAVVGGRQGDGVRELVLEHAGEVVPAHELRGFAGWPGRWSIRCRPDGVDPRFSGDADTEARCVGKNSMTVL